MAARLPLVLSQPARRDATATELIENIVAAALLVPKLDANLVGDIESIEPSTTDHLCLQGHTRDLILASFLDRSTAQEAWRRLDLKGTFIDCAQPAEVIRRMSSSTTDRRVYYFQLSHHLKVRVLLDQCQELVAAQAVQLVSIQPSAGMKSGALPIVSMPTSPAVNGHAHSHKPNGATESTSASRTAAVRPTAQASHDDDEDWSGIDKLVDDLDALDI